MKTMITLMSIILVSSILTMSDVEAQVSHVRGQVTDNQSEKPLEAATVYLYSESKEAVAITESDGSFLFEEIAPGRYHLDISLIGYISVQRLEFIVHSGKQTVLNIPLEESVISLSEVDILAYKDKHSATNELAMVSARSFNAEDTRRYAGSLNDPSRMASNFAGVSGANDARNDIIIRGNSPSGLLWRLEGVDIPNPNHFGAFGSTGGPVSMLNNNILAGGDFLTGAFPAEYGNALSGSFDLSLRPGNNEVHEFIGQIGYNGLELGAEGPMGIGEKSSYLINYRYSTLAFISALNLGDVSGTGAAIPYYQDLSFKGQVVTKRAGVFELFGVGGVSSIDLAANFDDPNDLYAQTGRDTYFKSQAGVVGLKHDIRLKNDWLLKTVISYSRFGQDTEVDSIGLNQDERIPFFGDQLREDRWQLHSKVQKKFNARNMLRAGVIATQINYNMRDSVFIEGRFIPLRMADGNTQLIQPYVQYQYKFTDKLILSGGVHAMYLSLNQKASLEPRAAIKYQATSRQSIGLAYGRHSQIQNMLTYFFRERNGEDRLSNMDLGFSRADHFVLSHVYKPSTLWMFKTELYYQILSNIPVQEGSTSFSLLNAGADFGIPSVGGLVNDGTGYNVGVELTAERRIAKQYYFLGTLSLFESKYRGSDQILRNTAFNGNYVMNILGGYEFAITQKTLLSLDIRNSLAGGRRITPIDLEASRAMGREVLLNDQAFEEQLPYYHKIDFRVTLRINGKNTMQEWFIDLQNITDRQNPFIRTFSPANGEILTINQLGFLPMFNYRILF